MDLTNTSNGTTSSAMDDKFGRIDAKSVRDLTRIGVEVLTVEGFNNKMRGLNQSRSSGRHVLIYLVLRVGSDFLPIRVEPFDDDVLWRCRSVCNGCAKLLGWFTLGFLHFVRLEYQTRCVRLIFRSIHYYEHDSRRL